MNEHNKTIPPYMGEEDKVILFDGVCKLCNAWSKFITRFDKHKTFKLASVQSSQGQEILKHFNMPTDSFETMLYIEGNNPFMKSNAFLEIMLTLGWPWKIFYINKMLPRPLRDWLYDRIALNRYTIFGKYDSCLLPAAEHEHRFLK